MKRYDIEHASYGCDGWEETECSDGDWVKWEDVIELIKNSPAAIHARHEDSNGVVYADDGFISKAVLLEKLGEEDA